MSAPVQLVKIVGSQMTFLPARLAASTAPPVPGAPTDEYGQQMFIGIARFEGDTRPLIAMTVVLGTTQVAVTLDPSEADTLCHALADAVLWQNDQLRQKAGQAVH